MLCCARRQHQKRSRDWWTDGLLSGKDAVHDGNILTALIFGYAEHDYAWFRLDEGGGDLMNGVEAVDIYASVSETSLQRRYAWTDDRVRWRERR